MFSLYGGVWTLVVYNCVNTILTQRPIVVVVTINFVGQKYGEHKYYVREDGTWGAALLKAIIWLKRPTNKFNEDPTFQVLRRQEIQEVKKKNSLGLNQRQRMLILKTDCMMN